MCYNKRSHKIVESANVKVDGGYHKETLKNVPQIEDICKEEEL